MTLRTRIAAAAGGAVAIALLAGAALVYVAIRGELHGEVESALRERAAQLVGDGSPLRRGGPPGRPAPAPAPGRPAPVPAPGQPMPRPFPRGGPPPRFGGPAGVAQLVAPDGSVIRPPDSAARLPVDRRTLEIARAGHGEALSDPTVDGDHLLVLSVGAGPRGAIQLARPLEETDDVLGRVLAILALGALGGVALAAALGMAVARAALAPIARFTRRTEELAAQPDPSQRMEAGGRDELSRLAASFNTTLDALARSVEAQRHLVADAGHELRTPLASLRANIQVLEEAERLDPDEYAALRADIVSELDELTALVGDITELARGTEPAGVPDDVRLDLVVQALVERLRRRAGDDLDVVLDAQPSVVRGRPERVGRAVSNLLDNARKWSPPGGRVEVAVADGTVTVRDHGPGFEEADLPHVFERFYRSGQARGMPGSGLGLAIVRQTVEAHGGSAEAANAPGGGALVRASFGPSSEPEQA